MNNKLLTLIKNQTYQSLPKFLSLDLEELGIESSLTAKHTNTFDQARLDYILKKVKFRQGEKILDIGSNSGFFAFGLAEAADVHVTAIEGDEDNVQFISTVAEHYDLSKRINAINQTYNLKQTDERYTVKVCLNVLHHVGRYFGHAVNETDAYDQISDYITGLLIGADVLILQLGFNWKGQESQPLYKSGTKVEIIEHVKMRLNDDEYAVDVGILDPEDNSYRDQTPKLLDRFDSLGEFANRPIFVIKRRGCGR